MARWRDHLVQHAVGPDTDLELVLERLEVHVAGLVLDRQQQHHVDQLADGAGIDQLVLAADVVLAGEDVEFLVVLGQFPEHVLDGIFLVGVVRGNALLDVLHVRHRAADVKSQEVAEIVQGGHVVRGAHGDGQQVVLQRDGHDLVDLGHRLGHQFQHLGRDGGLAEIHHRHAPLLGQSLGHLLVGAQLQPDGGLSEDFAGRLLLLLAHVPELLLGEVSEVDQDLSDASCGHG